MEEDPVRLVVKNTFIDVNDEGEIEDGSQSKPRNNRRASDTGVNYGSKGLDIPYTSEEAAYHSQQYGGEASQSGTFIDDVIHPPSGSFGKGGSTQEPKRVYVQNTFVDVANDSDDFGEETPQVSAHRRNSGRQSAQKPQKNKGQYTQSSAAPMTMRNPPAGASRQNKSRNSNSRASGQARHSGEFQFFNDGYTEARRRSSMLSVMTDTSPTAQQQYLSLPPYGYPDPHGGMPMPNAFGMPPPSPHPPMGYPPMGGYPPMPGMMPPPMMHHGYPGMAPPMPWPGGPGPMSPMSYQPPPGYPPSGVPGMPLPPPGMIADATGKGAGSGGHTRTTVMLRNLPPEYTRDMVVDLLNKEGFERLYDFVYMPMNLRTMASFGYVFVNLTSPIVADQCRSVFQGLSRWSIRSDKVCDVLWSDEQQGLSANIERYRNSPVMHESVPEECKPIVLANGVRVPFPSPTKRLREPRIRRPQAAGAKADE